MAAPSYATWYTPRTPSRGRAVAHRIAAALGTEALTACRAVVALRGLTPYVDGDRWCMACLLAAPREEP